MNQSNDASSPTPASASGTSSAASAPETERWVWIRQFATIAEAGSWAIVALSVIGGLVIAFQKDECDGWRCGFNDEYPLFWFGLILGLIGAIQGIVFVTISMYVKARALERQVPNAREWYAGEKP